MKKQCLLSHKGSQVQQRGGASAEGLKMKYSLTRPSSRPATERLKHHTRQLLQDRRGGESKPAVIALVTQIYV